MPLSRAFDQLRKGDVVVTEGRTITEADVLAFAAQTGDFHPQHVDAEWAAEREFGERIAHGMLTLSYAIGLVPLDPDHALAFRRLTDVAFTRPVLIGDTIRTRVEIRRLTPVDDEKGVVGLTIRALNQHDQTACRARVEVLWRRDSGNQTTEEQLP
jgi:3-hydroxybutyryl-CoA dehydratase